MPGQGSPPFFLPKPITSKGWAEMIRKAYEVDPLVCPHCGSFAVLMASMSAGG
jgi:hypothetical protein